MWRWVQARLRGARSYRYDGERETHAEQLRETQISLSMMASVGEDNPEHVRMASDIEHGAEARLTVLLEKPRLTIEEKRERDAIQVALAERRQGFGGDANADGVRIRPFLAAQPSFLARIFASPLIPYVLIGGVFLSLTGWGTSIWNGWRADRMETQRDRAIELAEHNAEAAARWRERSDHYRQGLEDAANVARLASDALEQERARRAAAAARERRRTREIQNVLTGNPEPPDWRLREPDPDSPGGASR